MTDTQSLIARLEQATGPDRELDADIAVAVDGGEIVWKMANYTMESYPARRHPSPHHIGGYCNAHVPSYTASIDAALTLVPSGKGHDPWWMLKAAWRGIAKAEIWVDGKGKPFRGEAATPALAICIAALRAIEARQQ